MYAARVEKYSMSPTGDKAASFVVTFPRVILAECLTHRMNSETWGPDVTCYERTAGHEISKNSASSRAIPFQKMVDKVLDDPYMPMWTVQQKGMQGASMTDAEKTARADKRWLLARDQNILNATYLHDELGIHKQDCNRLLEPWGWVTQIVTSSRWDNHFALRCHEKAFPPYRKLARMMYLALRKEKPVHLDYGEWHLPFVDHKAPFVWIPTNMVGMYAKDLPDSLRVSAARCAWTSYENHERVSGMEAVDRTFNSLFSEIPVHGSPVEHQLTPLTERMLSIYPGLRSNIPGFLQARKLIANETVLDCNFPDEVVATWDDIPEDMK